MKPGGQLPGTGMRCLHYQLKIRSWAKRPWNTISWNHT